MNEDLLKTNAMYRRMEREELLRQHVDSINPIRWETMTDAQKTALRNYRQALLDISKQSGFPMSVQWPTKPE